MSNTTKEREIVMKRARSMNDRVSSHPIFNKERFKEWYNPPSAPVTPSDKRRLAIEVVTFLALDCPRDLFTPKFYEEFRGLFHNIACFSLENFYRINLKTAQDRLTWLAHAKLEMQRVYDTWGSKGANGENKLPERIVNFDVWEAILKGVEAWRLAEHWQAQAKADQLRADQSALLDIAFRTPAEELAVMIRVALSDEQKTALRAQIGENTK